MSKIRFAPSVCLFLLAAFGAAFASGETLLIEIHQRGSSFGSLSNVGDPLHMAFTARAAPGSAEFTLEGWYDSDDVGMTFHATRDVVSGMQVSLSQPSGDFWLDIHSQPRGAHHADELWRTDWDPLLSDIRIQQFVPRLGVGLSGYDLSAVTQTVDLIRYTIGGANTVTSEQEQTIRLYGTPVPEPASVILMLGCHLLVISIIVDRHRLTSRIVN
ncbi:MAG TPA: hypothetical protein VGK58_23395 [Lacipirellulaceae bacterium]